MKRNILSFVCLLFGFNGFSQHDQRVPPLPEDRDKVFQKVETGAQFPGSSEDWLNFLKKNVNTKVPSKNDAPPGTYRVILHFKVDISGKVSDIKAETNYGYGMEEEAIRVLKLSPKWIPVLQNGKQVESYERRIITFVVE